MLPVPDPQQMALARTEGLDALPDLDNLATESDGTLQPPVSRGPIQLEPELLPELEQSIKRLIDAAQAGKGLIAEKLAVWRRNVYMDKRPVPPYEGAPNVTTALTRGRNDAVKAHIRNALYKQPLFVPVPLSPNAMPVLSAYETVLNSELSRTECEDVPLDAVDEGIDVGTGIIKIVVEDSPGGQKDVRAELVQLEDFAVYPVATSRMELVSTVQTVRRPYWDLLRDAEAGFIDLGALQKLASTGGPRPTAAQRASGSSDTYASANDVEWQPVEYYEIWTRYRGRLYCVLWHQSAGFLRVEPNFLPLAHPPYFRIAPIRRKGLWYGEASSQPLEPFQEAMDYAYNSLMAEGDFALAPIIITTDDNLHTQLTAPGAWEPGATFKATMPMTDENFRVVQLSLSNSTVEFMSLVDRQAEIASFSNVMVPGLPQAGNRTATEIGVVSAAGSVKLKMMLGNAARDLRAFVRGYWKVLKHFKVQGLFWVFDGETTTAVTSADEDFSFELIDSKKDYDIRKALTEFMDAQGIPPEMQQQALQLFPPQTTKVYIPSVHRTDVDWRVNGQDTIPEKQIRLQNLMILVQLIPYLPMASQDLRVWEILRQIMDVLDIPGYKKMLGEQPAGMNDQALLQFTGVLNILQGQQQGQSGAQQSQMGPNLEPVTNVLGGLVNGQRVEAAGNP